MSYSDAHTTRYPSGLTALPAGWSDVSLLNASVVQAYADVPCRAAGLSNRAFQDIAPLQL